MSEADRWRACIDHDIAVEDEFEEIGRCRNCGRPGHLSMPLVSDDEKRCSRCRLIKPLPLFPRQDTGSKGRYAYCLECSREYQRERRLLRADT